MILRNRKPWSPNLRKKQLGVLMNPFRFGGGGGGGDSDPYIANVSLLLHMDGGNGSTTFLDSSPTPKTVTANGNAVISTAQNKYGAGSAYFDGSGDFLSIPASSDFTFGAADFTVEGWVYTATTSGIGAIIGLANGSAANSNYAFQLVRNGSQWQFNVFSGSTAYGSAVGALSINTWYHIAMVRSGNSLYAFVDGALLQTTSITGVTLNAPSGAVAHIGQVQGYFPWNGYIDSLRVTKGVARYTAAFTPPTEAFPNS